MFELICAAVICIGAGEADVIDGDTFAARGAKFRLYGIQAPERGRPGFSEANTALAELISDQRLACEPRGASYDRYVVRCETANRTAHACELLADGMIDLMDRLDRLAEVAGHGDKGEIAGLSHQIVGAAGHMGLGLMSQLAAQVSQAARGGDPTQWVEALLEVRNASIGELREYCAACARATPGA